VDFFVYRPVYLWFLILIPLLVVIHQYSMKYVERKALRFANFKAIERVTGGETVPKNNWLLLMRTVTLVFFVFSAAGLAIKYSVPAHEYDLVIAIDASSSMSAQDFQPNRLEALKQTALGFVEAIPSGSRVGIVAFSSTAAIVAEPSTDKARVARAIRSVGVQSIGGTAVGDALFASANALDNSGAPKAILLATDGQSNLGTSVTAAVEYCKEQEVRLFAIGIGSPEAPDAQFPELFTGVDEESLSSAASETNGKYYAAPDAARLQAAFAEIAGKTGERTEENNLSIPLMALAFLFVFVDWSLSSSRYRIIP